MKPDISKANREELLVILFYDEMATTSDRDAARDEILKKASRKKYPREQHKIVPAYR
ncbi:hypothetical protein [Paenibacillus daejeonensis]|uniref:hypothetical protein n=1 Tax=Paenibacillus daejeonensis TaxID=135193 RepID=UPI00035D5FDF|nr:hypothetical protein [Paenibacillus daejeonensis]